MDIDYELNSIRTNLRTKNEDYDQHSFSFLNGELNKENLLETVNYFPFFSQEIQIEVIDQIFNIINICCQSIQEQESKDLLLLLLEIIQIFSNKNYLKMNNIFTHMVQLLNKSFNSNFATEIQQNILDTFSVFISTHDEFKNSNFFEFVSDLILYYDSTLNLLPLFISIIAKPPFPPKELIDFIVKTIYDNSYEIKYTANTFHFFEFCLKNSLEVNYDPFFQQIQNFLSEDNQEILSSFLDFLIAFPKEKPDLIDSLLQYEKNTKKNRIKGKIFYIFNIPRYFKIWKETKAKEITECASTNMKSEDSYLRTLAFTAFFSYQDFAEIHFDSELAQLMLDNFENPILTYPISRLLLSWLWDQSMNNDTKIQVYKTIESEYENLKVVINLNVDSPINQIYLLLESIIDIINNHDLD